MQASIFSVILSAFLSISVAQASVVTPGDDTKSAFGVDVPVNINVENGLEADAMELVGVGLRKKKVAFIKVNVYVAQFYSNQKDVFVRDSDEAIESVGLMDSAAMVLSFKRNVDSATMQEAFDDALQVNSVDTSKPHIQAFIDAVYEGSDAIESKKFVIYGTKVSDSEEKVIFEDSADNAVEIMGPIGFTKELMSMWLGQVANREVNEMKNQIIEGN